jgi:anti-anti-sigma factor
MAANEFRIIDAGSGLYRLEGVLDIHQAEKLKDFLENVSTGGDYLELSLAGLQYIDVCALQVLISFKHSPGVAVKLRIAELSREVEEVLAVCGLRTALLS